MSSFCDWGFNVPDSTGGENGVHADDCDSAWPVPIAFALPQRVHIDNEDLNFLKAVLPASQFLVGCLLC